MKKNSYKEKEDRPYFIFGGINPVIRFLTISDFLIISSFGLILPIFAIFVTKHIEGGNTEVAGIASAIYLITKSIGQIPIARFIDKIKGEKDDFWVLFTGSILFSLIPLAYVFISTPFQLYTVQFFYGFMVAMAYPTWRAIFTRHIDRNKEGIEWGVYQTLIDFGAAVSALAGGFMAYRFGFTPLFLTVSIFSLIGSLFLLFISKEMRPGYILKKSNGKQ